MNIRFGYRDVEFPSPELGELRDSSPLLGDMDAIREQMRQDGFLLLRGLLDRQKVLTARETILTYMDEQNALTPDTPILDGVMPQGGHSVPMMGRKGIVQHRDVRNVIESTELFDFFEAYFGEPALTSTYKWLRGVGNEQYTGARCDYVSIGQGSPSLHTVWIPLGDIPVDQGTLTMCPESNHLPSFAKLRSTYGRVDVDRDKMDGCFTTDPMEIVETFGSHWLTSEFYAGDVMIFGMHTMHASTTNLTDRFRLSCDVRFQPASEPADKRWVGDGVGHTALGVAELKSMEVARAEWGV